MKAMIKYQWVSLVLFASITGVPVFASQVALKPGESMTLFDATGAPTQVACSHSNLERCVIESLSSGGKLLWTVSIGSKEMMWYWNINEAIQLLATLRAQSLCQ